MRESFLRDLSQKVVMLYIIRERWTSRQLFFSVENMEELQDAIEDAQYMNAMHDDVPKPTKVCYKK